MLQLVLTSDTHLPRRARDLPEPLWAAIDAADVVVHAGDWVTSTCSTRWRRGPRGWWACTATTTGPRCGRGCRRSRGWSWAASGSPWCTRPGPPAGRERRCAAASRTSTCWCSGTATSPGTPPRPGRRHHAAPAQPRLADRPPAAADLHLDDGGGRRRHAGRRDPAPPAAAQAPVRAASDRLGRRARELAGPAEHRGRAWPRGPRSRPRRRTPRVARRRPRPARRTHRGETSPGWRQW